MHPRPTAPDPQVLARRRLGAVAAGGLVAVLAAAAFDVARNLAAPDDAASAPVGESAASVAPSTAPAWVWDQPPSSAPLPTDPEAAPVVTRVDTADPVVFLTIDDGLTRSIAARQAFVELGIPASLFLVDRPMRDAAAWFGGLPGTVVESHTRTHPDLRTLDEAGQRTEICGNAELVESTHRRRPVLFRPPYGSYDAGTQRAAAACGMRAIVLWQVTVRGDVVGFREVPQLRPGDIILMHFRPSFVQELHLIRDRVQAAGLRFALLEDYLAPDSVPPA